MKIFIDCDHHGTDLKEYLISYFSKKNIQLIDLNYGIDNPYPLIADNLAKTIQMKRHSRGILICKTGIGMSITANKRSGVYANNCSTAQECKLFRKINNGNVLCLGSQLLKYETAIELCKLFIITDFDVKNKRRIDLIESLAI